MSSPAANHRATSTALTAAWSVLALVATTAAGGLFVFFGGSPRTRRFG